MQTDASNRKLYDRIEYARKEKHRNLDLSFLDLKTLPESLGELTHLVELHLGSNQLTELPEWIGRLSHLTTLHLGRNRLKSIPQHISQLVQLEELHIEGNKLTTLPESIRKLEHIKELHLSDNHLTDLPEWIGELTQLTALSLDNNRLTELPYSIGRLINLRTLRVINNDLSSLPNTINDLYNIKALYLHGNIKLSLPPEILGPTWNDVATSLGKIAPQNPLDIVRFYFATIKNPKRSLKEAKILIVGEGGVGKTSLGRRLTDNSFDPDEERTDGIKIKHWTVCSLQDNNVSNNQIRVNMWDFGGQEIMHATHQFFLTKRSLYILVLDARKGENEGNIHYWLKIIQSYGGDSPVLIVINKYEDPNRLEMLNERRLSIDYSPNVKGFFKISCRDGTGLGRLRKSIELQINNLPHVYDEVPVSYFTVKKILEERAETEDFIDISEYRKICEEYGVEEKNHQNILLRFLHDLGSVLNFDDPQDPFKLRDTNILNPEWVTTGVYKILNNNLLMKQNGHLKLSELGDILNDHKRYPMERRQFIVEMMRKFELCFDFPDTYGNDVLIPELLPPNEPDLDWDTEEALRFGYHYTVLPSGVIPRFIVKTHHNLTNRPTYWRSGVVLDVDGNRSLVRGDTLSGKVHIAVFGPTQTRRSALSVIRNDFKSIHSSIPKLEVQEKIYYSANSSLPPIDYEHVMKLEKMGESSFIPEGYTDRISIKSLLDGIESRSERFERQQALSLVSQEKNDLSVNAESSTESEYRFDSETIKERIDQNSFKFARRIMFFFGSIILIIPVILLILTRKFGWDTVEPITYFVGCIPLLVSYLYYAITQHEFSFHGFLKKIESYKKLKEYSKYGIKN